MTYFRLWALYFDHPTHPGKWQVRRVIFRNGQEPLWEPDPVIVSSDMQSASACVPEDIPPQGVNREAEPSVRAAWLETVREPTK